jgi:hypothetical protein
MRPYLRYLRLGWTVLCVLATVLLIVLWVRSYFRTEFVERFLNVNRLYATGIRERIVNFPGTLELVDESVTNLTINYAAPGWKYRAYNGRISVHGEKFWRLALKSSPNYQLVRFPHWSALLIIGTVCMIPWLFPVTWRFSLGTLLIAMTLIAVGIGLIVSVSH